jgi:hypothetical protein
MGNAVDRGRIERRAYQIFEERGRTHGADYEDWLRAEKEITDMEKSSKPPRKKKAYSY